MIASVTEQWQELAAIGKRRAELAGREAGTGAPLNAQEGPGEPVQPGHPDPADAHRGYIESGHAAASPQHDPPNQSPLPPHGRGILTPLEMSAEALVVGHAGPLPDAMATHQARAAAMHPPMPAPHGEAR